MLPPKLIVLRPPEPGKGLGSSDDERSSLSFMLGHMLGACEGSAHCVLSCQELPMLEVTNAMQASEMIISLSLLQNLGLESILRSQILTSVSMN